MALDKPRNTSLPRANRPKVPTGSSMKRSGFDESSMRKNLKHPAVESSQLGDDIEEQDPFFRPWRGLSNPQDNINEEYEVEGLSEISQMKVYQALSADPNSARVFLACPVACHELWLKVKFDNEFLEWLGISEIWSSYSSQLVNVIGSAYVFVIFK